MTGSPARGLPIGRLTRWLFALPALVIGLLTLLPAPAASAHAFLTGSSPSDGATLASAPSEIRLSFSESVALEAMDIDIVDAGGTHYPLSAVHLADPAAAAGTEDPVEVVAGLPPLGPGAYRLSWRTLSSDDLHTTNGVLVFGVGEQVTAAGALEPTPPPDETFLRAAVFLSLAAALGGLLAGLLLGRPASSDHAWTVRCCWWWSAAGAGLGILAAAALLADQVLAGGLSIRAVLLSSFGAHAALREVGFGLLLLAALLMLRNDSRSALRRALVLAGAACVGIGTALMGHAGAGVVVSTTRVIADAMHLIAAAAWSGTLLLAVTVALPYARRGGGPAIRRMLTAFGVPAGILFGVMMVSGLYLASDVVGSVDALLLTFYGRTLGMKLLIVAIIGVLGLINHRRLRRRAAPLPARTVTAEAIAAVVVLFLAALLTGGQPAMELEFVRATESAVPLRDGAASDLQETLAIRPNVPGQNVILIGAADTRRPAPAPIGGVLVSVIDTTGRTGDPIAATRLAGGQWSVTTNLDGTGQVDIVVTVQRPGMADVSATYPWTISGPARSADQVIVSSAPLGDVLRLLSLLLLLVAVGGGVGLVRRRRRVQRTAEAGEPAPGRPGSQRPAMTAPGGPKV